jgi:hypothetical protein
MPFKSKAQRAWMYSNFSRMAKQWTKDTPKGKSLPAKKPSPTLSRAKRRRIDQSPNTIRRRVETTGIPFPS